MQGSGRKCLTVLAHGMTFSAGGLYIVRSTIIEMKRSEIEIKALRKAVSARYAGKENIMAIPTIDMIGTGQNICRLRLEAGISVKELQDIFGFSTPQAIYKWQHGTALPTIDNLIVLAAVLGVKVDDILVLNDMQITMSA